jgi:molecular chaperone DnaJ
VRQPKRDYYEVLGVPRSADLDQIRRAFRRLTRDLRPDVAASPEAEDRFREVSTAYNVLSQPRARFIYDHFGYRGRRSGVDNGGLGPPRVLGEVELEGYEAARGSSREVEIADEDVCGLCGGSGAAPGSEVEVCATCLGKGTVRVPKGLGGRWLKVEPCETCQGEGRFRTPCPECDGLGEQRHEQTITVRIPAGIEHGTWLRVAGEGENAYVVVHIKPGPKDSLVVRIAAVVLLVCAVALLVYLLVEA